MKSKSKRAPKIYSPKPPDWPVYGETGFTGFIVPQKGLRVGTEFASDETDLDEPSRTLRRKRGRPSFAPWFKQRARERLLSRQMPKRPTLNRFAEELLKEFIKACPKECPPKLESIRNMVRKEWDEMH